MMTEQAVRQVLGAWGVEAGVKLDAIWCLVHGAVPEEIVGPMNDLQNLLSRLETVKQTLAEKHKREAEVRRGS